MSIRRLTYVSYQDCDVWSLNQMNSRDGNCSEESVNAYVCRMLKGEIVRVPVVTRHVIRVRHREEQRIHWFTTFIFFIKWRFIRHFQGPTSLISSAWPLPHPHEQNKEAIGGVDRDILAVFIIYVALFSEFEFTYLYNLYLLIFGSS